MWTWKGVDTIRQAFAHCPRTDAAPVRKFIPKRVEATALTGVMTALPEDDTERFKPFMDKESFKRSLTETVFGSTCEQPAGSPAC